MNFRVLMTFFSPKKYPPKNLKIIFVGEIKNAWGQHQQKTHVYKTMFESEKKIQFQMKFNGFFFTTTSHGRTIIIITRNV